ncbi:MAG TPA: DedA family protein [Candidatus Methylomirabilis sp.]|nr:DedA family protein [Candidatus Methylomirabilis sp.]
MGTLRTIIADWGYLAIFAFVVLGNLGVPIPENSVLWIAGYFVWKGRLSLPLVLLVGIGAAVAGDNLGYWIGRRYGQPAVERHGRRLYLTPARLASMRHFVHRYGPGGVFIARFVIGLRFMAGPLAGSMGLAPLAFLFANVLGALVYVPVTVGEGYAVGYGYRRYIRRFMLGADTLETVLLAGAVLLALLFLAYQAVLHLRRREH